MASRMVSLGLIALLAMVHGQLWFGRGSVSSVARMNEQVAAQLKQNAQAQLANDRLAAEVRDLQEGQEMVEERARQELGMVKANEIFVQIAK
jgi:cell division protein FtsB